MRLGARRIAELVARYGVDTFIERARSACTTTASEAALRALAALPHGTFSLAEEQDSGAVYRVERADLAPTSWSSTCATTRTRTAGPANVSRDGAVDRGADGADEPRRTPARAANAGHFRPLSVLTRPGSVFDPCEPAAMRRLLRGADPALRPDPALPRAAPRGPAAGRRLRVDLRHVHRRAATPTRAGHFTIVEPEVGGWGATAERDGLNAQFSSLHGDTFTCPAEVAEARYGLYVDRLELSSAPGGEGARRGGKGILLEYRVRGDGCFLTCAYTRSTHPPWGQAGGRDGSPNFVEVVRRRRHASSASPSRPRSRWRTGDVIRIHTGNGGGYGARRTRPERCSTTPERLRQPRRGRGLRAGARERRRA